MLRIPIDKISEILWFSQKIQHHDAAVGVAEDGGQDAVVQEEPVRVQQRRPGIPQKNYYCSYRTKDPVRVVNGHSSALMEYASWVALPKPGEYIYRPEKTGENRSALI